MRGPLNVQYLGSAATGDIVVGSQGFWIVTSLVSGLVH